MTDRSCSLCGLPVTDDDYDFWEGEVVHEYCLEDDFDPALDDYIVNVVGK